MAWQRRVLRNRLLFESEEPDACHLAILAGVHGDERAGFHAFDRIVERLHREPLLRGRLSLIPGNLPAVLKKRPKRCVSGQDMNRLFLDPEQIVEAGLSPSGADYARAQEVKRLLHDADYLLDLHSTTAPCEPFAVTQDINETTLSLMSGFPVDLVDHGYRGVVPGSSMDWIEQRGGIGITVECGQHHQAAGLGAKVAYRSAIALLRNLGMLAGHADGRRPSRFRRIVHRGLIEEPASLRYEPWFQSDARVEFGQLIARDSRTTYRAPTREQVEARIGSPVTAACLTAIMVTPALRVAKVRPYDAFLLGMEG